jgi:putative oxidoreductase
MQRLFSSFAGGWPGTGLFLFRLLTGATLIYSGIVKLHDGPPLFAAVLLMISVAAGVFLIVGLLTPVTGVLAAVAKVWLVLLHIPSAMSDQWIAIAEATLAAGLAMIGPGAWSIDARRFGRKRII